MSEKCIIGYLNLAQLGNHGPDHVDDIPRVALYQQEFCRNTPSTQMRYCFQ